MFLMFSKISRACASMPSGTEPSGRDGDLPGQAHPARVRRHLDTVAIGGQRCRDGGGVMFLQHVRFLRWDGRSTARGREHGVDMPLNADLAPGVRDLALLVD